MAFFGAAVLAKSFGDSLGATNLLCASIKKKRKQLTESFPDPTQDVYLSMGERESGSRQSVQDALRKS